MPVGRAWGPCACRAGRAAVGEAAVGVVDLRAGDAEIGEDAIDLRTRTAGARWGGRRSCSGKVESPAGRRFERFPREGEVGGVEVDADEPAGGFDASRIAAECPPRPRVQSTIVCPGWGRIAASTASKRTGMWRGAWGMCGHLGGTRRRSTARARRRGRRSACGCGGGTARPSRHGGIAARPRSPVTLDRKGRT